MRMSDKMWRTAFFILLTVVFAFIITLILLYKYYFPPISNEELFIRLDNSIGSETIFTVHTNRENLNYYFQDRQEGKYLVNITSDNIVFLTSVPIFSSEVLSEIMFTPEVLENGDLLLHTQSMRVGRFQFPKETILQFIKQYVELPEWVMIYPSQAFVHIEMDKINIGSDLKVFFIEFELQEDSIIMGVSGTKVKE